MLHARPVLDPIPSQEDEAIEHHPGPDHGDVLERFFEDDEDMTVHERRIGNPPKVQPVAVQLMIRNHDQSLRKSRLESAILRLHQLPADGGVAADPDDGWGEPLCHGHDEETKPLLGHGHVGVVVVFADDIERRAEDLGSVDDTADEGGP